jgi:hypothetical protein
MRTAGHGIVLKRNERRPSIQKTGEKDGMIEKNRFHFMPEPSTRRKPQNDKGRGCDHALCMTKRPIGALLCRYRPGFGAK